MTNHTPPTDEGALIRLAQQEGEAFRELYRLYFPRVYAYVAYRVGRVHDAEDVTADIFVKVVEAFGRFEYRGSGSFAAWLFRIAHNEVQQFYRRHRWQQHHISLEDVPNLAINSPNPEALIQRKEQFTHLYHLINALSPRRQEIITLRFFGELRNQDIALVLGLDERTIASHLCRALDDLQQKFQPGSKITMMPENSKRKRTPRRALRWIAAVFFLLLIGGSFVTFRLAMTPMSAAPQIIEPKIGCWSQPANVTFYLVQEGDTLASIAQDYDVPYEDLLAVNCLFTNPQPLIAPGTLLTIPKVGTLNPEIQMPTFVPVPTVPPLELSAPTMPPQGVFRVWVAHEKIEQGTIITENMVIDALIPIQQALYQGQYAMPAILYGKVALIDIAPNVPILRLFVGDASPPDMAWTMQAVVARIEIPYGTKIEPDMLMVAAYPQDVLTELEKSGYFFNTVDEAIGRYATKTLPAWQPLQMKDTTNQAPDETGLVLPPGTVAVSLPLSAIKRVDDALRVGDTIDVIAAMLFVDVDDMTQMPESIATAAASAAPQLMLERSVQNALIVQFGNFPSDSSGDTNTQAEIITLAVSPQDATVLTWLVEAKIPMTFALSRD